MIRLRGDWLRDLLRRILCSKAAPDLPVARLRKGDRMLSRMLIGRDARKATTSVALAQEERDGEVRHCGHRAERRNPQALPPKADRLIGSTPIDRIAASHFVPLSAAKTRSGSASHTNQSSRRISFSN